MSVKIHSLSIENTKRVRAVTLQPAQDGLTVIGGRNGQGKTSVLDAIAWALGGDRFRPSRPERSDSALRKMFSPACGYSKVQYSTPSLSASERTFCHIAEMPPARCSEKIMLSNTIILSA